jgi:hypothetical protein
VLFAPCIQISKLSYRAKLKTRGRRKMIRLLAISAVLIFWVLFMLLFPFLFIFMVGLALFGSSYLIYNFVIEELTERKNNNKDNQNEMV